MIEMRNLGIRCQMGQRGADVDPDLVALLAWAGSQIEDIDRVVG